MVAVQQQSQVVGDTRLFYTILLVVVVFYFCCLFVCSGCCFLSGKEGFPLPGLQTQVK